MLRHPGQSASRRLRLVAHSAYSRRLLESVKLPSAKTDLLGDVARLEGRALPLVHELQRYQRADGSVEPRRCGAATAALSALSGELGPRAPFPLCPLGGLVPN